MFYKSVVINGCLFNITFSLQLLKDEIQRERNHLLQIIRYVVDNNFFDKKPIFGTDSESADPPIQSFAEPPKTDFIIDDSPTVIAR